MSTSNNRFFPQKNRTFSQKRAAIKPLTHVFAAASGSANKRKKPVSLAKIKVLEPKNP
jgi:hypothetical protein